MKPSNIETFVQKLKKKSFETFENLLKKIFGAENLKNKSFKTCGSKTFKKKSFETCASKRLTVDSKKSETLKKNLPQ